MFQNGHQNHRIGGHTTLAYQLDNNIESALSNYSDVHPVHPVHGRNGHVHSRHHGRQSFSDIESALLDRQNHINGFHSDSDSFHSDGVLISGRGRGYHHRRGHLGQIYTDSDSFGESDPSSFHSSNTFRDKSCRDHDTIPCHFYKGRNNYGKGSGHHY